MNLAINLWLVLLATDLGPKSNAQDDWVEEIDKIHRPELDKDWRDYVDKLGGEYEEEPHSTPKNDEDDPKYLKEFLDWNPTSPREVPFLAILYTIDRGPSQQYKEFFKGEPDPGPSHIEPGTACGGALLSPKHVLTQCGCLSYVITGSVFKDLPTLFKWNDKTPKYNLRNFSDPEKPPVVYVTFTLLRFVPDQEFQVDTDQSKWAKSEGLTCRRLIKTDGQTPDPKIRARRADGEVVAVPFKPAAELGFYPFWPPSPINAKTDPNYKGRVIIASIGMRLTEKTIIRFHSSVQVSSLEAIHCNDLNDICDAAVFSDRDDFHPCFCPITRDKMAQLVGGTIGWPVVDSRGNLVGLTASERHSADGTLVVTMITQPVINSLEIYIGKSTLENQNTVPLAYRQKDLSNEFLLYDYWAAQFRTPTPRSEKPKQFSRATKTGLNLTHLIFVFTAYCYGHKISTSLSRQ